MDQSIQNFIECKRIAVLGASRSGKKFGNSIVTELKTRGYTVSIIHPEASEIGGERCYPSLEALPEKAEGVVICVPPRQAGEAVRAAVGAGVKNIWLQQGAESPEVVNQARALGVEPVAGKCILMYAPPVRSFHRWHRGFVKLIGQL